MRRLPILIDTDPGQDDAIALLLAAASPELELIGITTVAGNVPLALTTRNARVVMALAGRHDLPICAGAAAPLDGLPLVTAEHVHGATGLDGVALPEPRIPLDPRPGVDFIVQTLREREAGTVTLCPLGPLSNIALALRQAPEIAPRIRRIVLMGGGYFEGGNVTPAAEFNFYVDPQAAHEVFMSGVPITMAPLDVTHQALTTAARIEAIRRLGNRTGAVVAAWMEFFERYDEAKYGTDGAPLHDPCVIAWLLAPELFTGRDCNVRIEVQSALTRGASVVDWWQVTGLPPNAHVLGGVDADGFFALLTDRLARPPSFYSLEGVAAAIAAAQQDATEDRAYQFLVRNAEGLLVARVNLHRVQRQHFHSAELGYRVAQAQAGRGIASAAVAEVLRRARDLKLHRLEAHARPENPASCAVLRRNGFKEFGRASRAMALDGRWYDLLYFEHHWD